MHDHRDRASRHRGGAEPPDEVRAAIADATTADTRRQDLLVDYARRLGPDPELADLDAAELTQAVRIGAAEIAAATCRWLGLLAELVVRGQWADDGARNPAHWLSWALGIAPSTGREQVRVALRLRECPLVRERFAAGSISYSKVRAITRVCTPQVEQLLLDWADSAPAHVLERIISDTRRQQRTTADLDDRDHLGVTRRWREDGSYELVLRTDAATGLEIEQHLDRLAELDQPDQDGRRAPGDEPDTATDTGSRPSRARREADLVAGALAAAVEAGPDDTSGSDRHLVVLHANAADLLAAADSATTARSNGGQPNGDVGARPAMAVDEGASVEAPQRRRRQPLLVHDGRGRTRSMSATVLWRLACSARLQLAVDRNDGHPADLGRARRAPDARLRRLLASRDRTCRFPGCAATRYLHAHHVTYWSEGGETSLDNLVLLCGHHHTVVHRGWQLRPDGPGRWTFHRDDDQPHPWTQPLPGASAEALTAAARAHAHDLDPDARARLLQPTHWDGQYDHDLTIGILAERLSKAA